MIAFGPLPSRRLGQSLGVNHIPPKHCSYDCAYCQVGPTPKVQKLADRQSFFAPEAVFQAVKNRVEEVQAAGGRIDYLSLVPDGEPTLDLQLGKIIEQLRPLGIKIAVITNSSLLWDEAVRRELALADYVSLKVDAVEEKPWRIVNRPNPNLALKDILAGALAFAASFAGILTTETMLLRGINDQPATLKATATFVGRLQPAAAYLCIPTRPPLEKWALAPDEMTINLAYQIFSAQLEKVECLTGHPVEAFTATGDVVQHILNTTAVHPIRESEALDLLQQGGLPENVLAELVAREELVRVIHDGQAFYVRKLHLTKGAV